MGHNWKSKSQFQRLSFELARHERTDFERAVLPYLRLIAPTAMQTQAQGSLDVAGVDLVVPGKKDGRFELGVQCKGFQVTETRIARDQIRQCVESIKDFAQGSAHVEKYWLVHNRSGNSKMLHDAVIEHLNDLVRTGRAKEARLFDRDAFLAEILNRVFVRFRQFISERCQHFEESGAAGLSNSPVEKVPYQVQEVRVSQYRFDDSSASSTRLGDPLDEATLTASGDSRLGLLLGKFGMGKTTLAFRLANRPEHLVLYVPAAVFPPKVSGTKELLKYLTGAAEFVDAYPIEDQPAVERMARLMSDKLLSENESRLVLVIDGLDESPFLTSGNGLPTLFDALSNIRSRAVLTMRTEFWLTRSESLLTGYAGRAAPTKRSERNRRLTLIELQPWENEQMSQLVEQARAASLTDEERQKLALLAEKIRADGYTRLYGDIPRKPLFLRLLIDFVAEHGVTETSLARLFREWVDMKLRRDVIAPLSHSGPGRSGITAGAQAADVVRTIAMQSMKAAAVLMTKSVEHSVELLPQCNFDALSREVPALAHEADMAGLVLNSLLTPTRKHGAVVAVQFAHRAFQEYFLARTMLEDDALRGVTLPDEVTLWLERLRVETAS